MGVVDMTGATERIWLGGGGPDRAAPGETKRHPLERIDVQEEEGDARYRELKAIAGRVSCEWQPLAEVEAIVAKAIDKHEPGWSKYDPWQEWNVEHTTREAIESGLLQDRRNAQGEAEVRSNPDPPRPLTAAEVIAQEDERRAAEERRLVRNAADTRERLGREEYERSEQFAYEVEFAALRNKLAQVREEAAATSARASARGVSLGHRPYVYGEPEHITIAVIGVRLRNDGPGMAAEVRFRLGAPGATPTEWSAPIRAFSRARYTRHRKPRRWRRLLRLGGATSPPRIGTSRPSSPILAVQRGVCSTTARRRRNPPASGGLRRTRLEFWRLRSED